MTKIQVQAHEQRGDERCAYCHDGIASAERVTCPGCGAPYHRECLHDELGACGIRGCGRRVQGARPDLIRVRLRERELPQVGEEVPCVRCGRDFVVREGGRTHTLCARCNGFQILFALAVIAGAMALFAAYVVLASVG